MADSLPTVPESPLEQLTRYYIGLGMSPAKAGQLAARNADKPLAQFMGNAGPILDRLENGENARQIAKSLGVDPSKLYAFLIAHEPEAWQEISAGKALDRLESVEQLIDDAQTMTELGKARERAKIAQWQLERVARKTYSPRPEEQSSGITINVNVDRGIHTITVDQDPI